MQRSYVTGSRIPLINLKILQEIVITSDMLNIRWYLQISKLY